MRGRGLAGVVAVVLALGAVPAGASTPVSSGHGPVAVAAKTCQRGVLSNTPGGQKCLQPGEYCSHAAGYAAAYRRKGFVCAATGRLRYR